MSEEVDISSQFNESQTDESEGWVFIRIRQAVNIRIEEGGGGGWWCRRGGRGEDSARYS